MPPSLKKTLMTEDPDQGYGGPCWPCEHYKSPVYTFPQGAPAYNYCEIYNAISQGDWVQWILYNADTGAQVSQGDWAINCNPSSYDFICAWISFTPAPGTYYIKIFYDTGTEWWTLGQSPNFTVTSNPNLKMTIMTEDPHQGQGGPCWPCENYKLPVYTFPQGTPVYNYCEVYDAIAQGHYIQWILYNADTGAQIDWVSWTINCDPSQHEFICAWALFTPAPGTYYIKIFYDTGTEWWTLGQCQNFTVTVPEICTWIADKGGPFMLTITDVFTIIDSYLFETPPTGYTFIPTLQNVFGVIDYYLGFNGDAATGCDFFP